jgi:hypothetical protein
MDLYEARLLKRVKQYELQAMAKVFQSRISMAEKGLISLRRDEKERIEKALGGVRIDWKGTERKNK